MRHLERIGQELVTDLVGSLVIASSILVLFVVAEVWKRLTDVPTEHTRKLTHLGSGVIVMSFPWLVSSVWSVVLLAASFGGLLVLGKLTGLLSSIHDVERKTQGAYLYPLAVLGTFVLSDGDPLLFCVPLAVMAVADTGAALVGKHAGGLRYRVLDGERSLEGSLTFFGLAFAIVVVGLALAGRPGWPASLLVTLVVAILTTSVEAASIRGSDNLLIPYAAWLALDRTLDLGLAGLEPWLLGMLLSGSALALSWRQADLTVAGAITVFLVGSLSYAEGSWAWALPFYGVYGLFLLAKVPRSEADLDDVFATAAGSLVLLLAYVHLQWEQLYLPFLVTISANGGILMGFLVRQWSRRREGLRWAWAPAVTLGVGVPLIPAALLGHVDARLGLLSVLGGLIGTGVFVAIERLPISGRRLLSSLLVGLGALLLGWLIG
jgi:phytol kinase